MWLKLSIIYISFMSTLESIFKEALSMLPENAVISVLPFPVISITPSPFILASSSLLFFHFNFEGSKLKDSARSPSMYFFPSSASASSFSNPSTVML